jgi:hypothetical protein
LKLYPSHYALFKKEHKFQAKKQRKNQNEYKVYI